MKSSFTWKKEENNQDNDFKISETMLFSQLPESISNQFINVYKSIKSNRQYLEESKLLESKKIEEEITNEIKNMKSICMNDLFLSINSFGHQIDNGIKMLKKFQEDLDESKNDQKLIFGSKNDQNSLFGSKNEAAFPSPVLVRYSKQLEEASDTLSEEIEAYRSHLQSLSNSNDSQKGDSNKKNDILFDFFNEEYEALLRSSTKISQLCKKLSYTRELLCRKLKIDNTQLLTESKDAHDSVFQTIQTKYNQFLTSKRANVLKSIKESNLFGDPTRVKAQAAPKSPYTPGSFIANRSNKDPNFKPKLQINTAATTITPSTQSMTNRPVPETPAPGKQSPFK